MVNGPMLGNNGSRPVIGVPYLAENVPSQRGPVRESVQLEGELQRSQFHFLWPNLGVNIFAGRANISIMDVKKMVMREFDNTDAAVERFAIE